MVVQPKPLVSWPRCLSHLLNGWWHSGTRKKLSEVCKSKKAGRARGVPGRASQIYHRLVSKTPLNQLNRTSVEPQGVAFKMLLPNFIPGRLLPPAHGRRRRARDGAPPLPLHAVRRPDACAARPVRGGRTARGAPGRAGGRGARGAVGGGRAGAARAGVLPRGVSPYGKAHAAAEVT